MPKLHVLNLSPPEKKKKQETYSGFLWGVSWDIFSDIIDFG